MKCDKCGENLQDNNTYEFKGKKLCADCYIDLIIGVPDVDFSKLPPETRCQFNKVRKSWHRDRPNRHWVKYCSRKKN